MADLPTGTVTFLFTDIAGSTQLWEWHPTEMPQTLARHDALMRQAVLHLYGEREYAATPLALPELPLPPLEQLTQYEAVYQVLSLTPDRCDRAGSMDMQLSVAAQLTTDN